ncbi:helicase C-terminal domain-containing protein [Jeotgalibacillus proteolyticus]|uniref:ATP-dependent helicase n=1 Tax=Jeotgalibacillus proteolyticus TaxID=2082395 RepID=A0A2S5G9U1_9BACL|nr:helicase C-terminal domain-containing protein [Jeotgalibacillus proteolyticus]PPA69772.1 ATP-dependent helicase [Jeotgalibacillus proteolyticus]
MSDAIKISARRLAEYVHRSGSIDAGIGSAAAMLEGTKIHQAIQQTYTEQDHKELHLAKELEAEGAVFQLEGRCDGLLLRDNRFIIDEIKSTARLLEEIEEPSAVHVAQAAVYAWIVCEDKELEEIDIQVTYVQTITKEEKRFLKNWTIDSLRAKVREMVRCYAPFAKLMKELRLKRNESIQSLAFPYEEFRTGQRRFAGAVYQTISEKGKLFAQAPTGIGKTISTLFPAIKSIGEGNANQAVYSTAKTITRKTAEEAFSLMQEKGLKMSAVTLTAKDKICFQEKTICQKEYCEFADGHFDRINEAVLDIMRNELSMTRTVIEQYAFKHRVCPFEFSMDLSYITDVMIGDYNYVFDPRVARKRLAGEQKRSTVLLVDEAHNLVDRAREMYSASIQKSTFLALSKSASATPALKKAAKGVNRACLDLKKQCGEERYRIFDDAPDEWKLALLTFYEAAEERVHSGETDQEVIDLYFAAQRMLHVMESMDERFYFLVEKKGSDVGVKIVCMDPSLFIKETTKTYRAGVFFSATLAPISYVRQMLGGAPEDYGIAIPSPFKKEQIDVRTYSISTKYRDRERTLDSILNAIEQGVKDAKGNFIAFFPSYSYMEAAVDRFSEQMDLSGYDLMVQSKIMTEEEREAFLLSFKEKQNIIAFAVMGGIFSEGVDLPGDQLAGAAIVGVGLPQLNPERDQMKKYFQEQGKNGYHFAYVYPGINKVLQAGGRLIRTEEDQGILLLIDDRFQSRLYQELLPEEWRINENTQTPG